MTVSFFGRLMKRGFEVYMFNEQYWLAAGLEELSDYLFYDGKIINTDFTGIENREGAREAVEIIDQAL